MDNTRNDVLTADEEANQPDNGATSRNEQPNIQDAADPDEDDDRPTDGAEGSTGRTTHS